MTQPQLTYTVHCFASVRVPLRNIKAASYREAIYVAIERFDWDQLQHEAEFTDEFVEFLVDIDGDDNFERSQWFDATVKERSV